MIRRIFWPVVFAVLGLTIGWFVLWVLVPASNAGLVRDWRILLSVAAGAALVAALATRVALQHELSESTITQVHVRQMWVVYPLWLLATAGFGGSHVSNLFLSLFSALSGVLLGNLFALVGSTRTAA